MPMSLLGRPLVVTEKVSALGTQGDLSFVDFGFYLIGDRQAMSATSSEHYKFNQDVTAFRIIERVDGRPWVQSAITPANGSTNTLSPFVQLQAR
jgi:HK97 family phage major capsid protein